MARKGIRRTIQRVTNQQRASALNKNFYQVGSEWKEFHMPSAVEKREQRIAGLVPTANFVYGIVHVAEAHDGGLPGVKCNC